MNLFHPLGTFARIIVYSTPSLIIIIACLMYMEKGDKLTGRLMLFGTIASLTSMLISSIFYGFGLQDKFTGISSETMYGISLVLSLGGSFMFAFGFKSLISSLSHVKIKSSFDQHSQWTSEALIHAPTLTSSGTHTSRAPIAAGAKRGRTRSPGCVCSEASWHPRQDLNL